MTKRIPIFSTLVVLLAVSVMIALGFWQLGRAKEKEALLAHYAQAQRMSSDVQWPRSEDQADARLYRHTRFACEGVSGIQARAGRSARGESGWAHVADCMLADGTTASVVLGWARAPDPVEWSGGEVMGFIAPGPRLVASPALAGLEDNAMPDPSDLPNNHMSYAVQWFLFALTALVIYFLALRRKWRTSEG